MKSTITQDATLACILDFTCISHNSDGNKYVCSVGDFRMLSADFSLLMLFFPFAANVQRREENQ